MLHPKPQSWLAPLWAVLCVGLVWWAGEPPAAAVDPVRASRAPVVVPALAMTTRVAPVLRLSDYFPNPNPTVQAIGNPQQARDRPATDRRARLRNASELPPTGIGYRVTAPGLRRNYGTYELVELVQQASAAFATRRPNRPVLVGDLSRRQGGTIRERDGTRVHSSHRNGLDADIHFVREPCGGEDDGHRTRCPVDVLENLELMRLFVAGGPDESQSLVRALYVGERFRGRMCHTLERNPGARSRYAGVLERMDVMGGHEAHFHVRLHCPALSRSCPSRRLPRVDPCGIRD